jgi:hypothetical protein
MTPMELDGLGRLARDATCVRCGHNLRGLPPDGLCCECGQPVDISLSGSPLAGAEPQWLERVCAGTGLLTLLLPWLWLPLAWPVVLVAGWLAAAPNPADLPREARRSLALRSLLMIILVVPPLAAWIRDGPPATWLRADILALLALVAGLLLIWTVVLTRRLSRHVGQKGLRRAVQFLSVCWFCAIGLLVCTAALMTQGSASTIDDIIFPFVIVGIAAVLGGLIALPIILIRLWRELDVAATLARSRRDRRRAHAPATPPPASDAAPPARH